MHCDLWGPNNALSLCDAIYFYTIVDDFSRAVWVCLLRNKEAYKAFCSFFAMVERQFETTITIVRGDNGTKFKCMLDYFDEHCILCQLLMWVLCNKMVKLSGNINIY